ncbi:hypothetical protein [Aquabacterium sp.]|uniref:hypothetical protein n=1 Tax=Aquabacterium sp. TaxID=1872578 RepID=UPI003B707EF6
MSEDQTLPPGKILGIVAEHIEPVTRFDAQDLSEAKPETAFQVEVSLQLDQSVSFDTTTTHGAAKLSAWVDKVHGESAFCSELSDRLHKAQREAPQAIAAWAQDNAGHYRRLLPANACFISAPGPVGYEHTCTTCSGACRVTCPSCYGRGRTDCTHCYGSGKINCYSCHGSKKVSCSSCYGRGNWSEQVSESTWSHTSNSYVTTYRTVHHNCSACYGSGQTTCHSCGYDGKISCGVCSGQGHINCMRCNTTGQVDCSACLASGIQHVWGTVKATVAHDEQLSIATDNATVQQLIETRLPRENLPEFGALTHVEHRPQGSWLSTQHTVQLDVREANVQASGETFVLYGFGPDAKVFSFENIAGHMLTEDLERLEACVSQASKWRRQKGSDLLDTTADFLRSELNLLLAEKVADHSASPDAAAQAVEAHFTGLVDASYVSRATQALRGALARLYGTELLEPAASLCGLSALAAGVQYGFGFHNGHAGVAVLTSLLGGAVAWFGLEWLTRRRIARRFEADFGKRVVQQLAANGSIKRWRMGVGGALLAANVLAIMGTNALPPVRAHKQELAAQAATDQLLISWLSAGADADLRQRTYPDHAQLVKRAEAGDQRALVVLAWQLLLGTGQTPKDVAEAGKWLDKARSETMQSGLWQTAKAVQILNQDAMPDDLRAAAQKLNEGAKQGHAEARYWLARLYLAEHSPVHDARQGIKQLTQAADQRHAHAALLLGQKYANGNGVPRNLNQARRYLFTASGAGLAEANEVLNQLK